MEVLASGAVDPVSPVFDPAGGLLVASRANGSVLSQEGVWPRSGCGHPPHRPVYVYGVVWVGSWLGVVPTLREAFRHPLRVGLILWAPRVR